MSIEQTIAANTEAMIALTAAIVATAGLAPNTGTGETKAAAKAETKTATKAAAAAPKGPTKEEMIAVLTKLKEEQGAEVAKGIVKAQGGVVKMSDIPEAKFKAVFDAAKKALEGAAEPEAEEDL